MPSLLWTKLPNTASRSQRPLINESSKGKRKLGGVAGMGNPFPLKPKGMHWKTYHRLQSQIMRGKVSYMQKMDKVFSAFSARYP